MEEFHQVYFKDIREKIIENIKLAKFEILIAVAWLTDEKIIMELTNCANRNVSVSILFYDDHINKKDLFKNLYNHRAKIKFTRKLMHNKFCIIDKKIVINGSYNWTYNASSNHENITISSNNFALVNQFTNEFNTIFETGNLIDSHFKNIVNEITELEYDYYSEYQNSNIFPYFYHIDDKIEKLKFGFYFIKNVEEEESFHKILYFLKLNYSIIDVNKIINHKLKIPKRFDAVINIRYVKNKIIVPEYFYKNTIAVEEVINYKKYIYNIDDDGNQIGSVRFYFEEKLPNGFYYYFYNPLYKSSQVRIYDRNLKLTELDIYKANIIDNIGIIGIKNSKFGLYSFEGKLLVEHIFDGYKITKDYNLEFQEFPILVCENPTFPKDYIQKYSTYLPKSEKGNETFIPSYYNVKTKKIDLNKEKKIVNKKAGHTYYFLSDGNNVYKYLYSLVATSAQYKITYKEMDSLKEHCYTNPSAVKALFEYQQEKQKNKETKEREKKEREAKNCYIATMVYKDINHPQVEFLRLFRDQKLKKNYLGKKFITLYYKYSENIAINLKNKKKINSIIKSTLDVLIILMKKLNN